MVVNARPLDFHRNNAAVGQARLVHLRQRSAAKRRWIDFREQLRALRPVDVVHGGKHFVKRQRVAAGLQFLQLRRAIRWRQNFERVDNVCPIFTKLGPKPLAWTEKDSGVNPFVKWCFCMMA